MSPELSPTELAQLDVIAWLVGRGYLTADGLDAVRGSLVAPRYRSLRARQVLVEVIRSRAAMLGRQPSDDPAWPAPDDPVFDAPLPEMPDDLSGAG